MLLEETYRNALPFSLLIVLVAVCGIVGVCFSSVFVAVKLVFTVLLPIAAEYGLLVCVYQYGWLEPFGVSATDGVFWKVLYDTPGLLFGLAIDYDLFLFTRVYERRMQGFDNLSAVRIALEETAPVIT